MKPASSQDAAAVFDPLRPLLIRVAHRMLGSVADAEDVVQDVIPTNSGIWLTPCIDDLGRRSARA